MKWVAVVVLLCACSKTKLPECEALVATADKISKCDKLPPENSIKAGVEQIRSALKLLEEVGDQAPKEQLDAMAKTCAMQHAKIKELYEKVAPECLK